MEILKTPIEFLKGVGPMRADLLRKELNIYTYNDLLFYYPFRYVDKTKIYKISELDSNMPFVQIKGNIVKIEEVGKGRSKRLIAYLEDASGIIQLVWFKGIRWIKQGLKLNVDYIVFGKPSRFRSSYNIVHPEIDKIDDENSNHYGVSLQGVYNSTEKLTAKGLNSRGLQKLIKNLFPLLKNEIRETLSQEMIDELNLPSRDEALFNVHLPKNNQDLIS